MKKLWRVFKIRIRHYDHNRDYKTCKYIIFFKSTVISKKKKKKKKDVLGTKEMSQGLRPKNTT